MDGLIGPRLRPGLLPLMTSPDQLTNVLTHDMLTSRLILSKFHLVCETEFSTGRPMGAQFFIRTAPSITLCET